MSSLRYSTKPVFEFHISREIRDFYDIDDSLFAQSGNAIFPNFFAVRSVAAKMNKRRDLSSFPEHAIKAGQLNAMGLIDEILHYILGLYKDQTGKSVFADAIIYLKKDLGEEELEYLLNKFTTDFPPLSVYRKQVSVNKYLSGKTGSATNREIALEEILLLYLANLNPAFSPFKELFDDTTISKETGYRKAMMALQSFFDSQPEFGPESQNLIDMLRTPAIRYPNSLTAQLEFIRKNWGVLLSKFIMRLLGGLDLIKEEEKPVFSGPGPTYLPDFDAISDEEYERFSKDLDWMPRVVMMAKSTYVWLDQLSKKYKRDINKLDHIPDEELDSLAARGFTGLWLIGLWERSASSQKIKQLCGNPEAVSSAYSLYDYTIAYDLGGVPALNNLRERAWKRGVRLASDMVPNHMGLFSKWVIEHPDWFIQSEHPLFPGYSFNGPNLSDDDRVGIFIEDGYWNRTDAAVIFKRVDHHTGDVKYIYHGNDGTSMPWNDTAQLNFLISDVREAVIQTILHVARQFPIIRLDAAMTLAKKHFQRLWFPPHGSGGDIPTRSEFAISREKFNEMFPVEFWREVVDRVAQEVPDTLLLAEAFWMMEGYFVRTLGMHRVYNSAFMNMLKNEENQKYRQAIKDVMDFNPEIMKRYVNFMNNPDEETAVAQFGKDDKYFGVCILMSTLPGLPMFGHGQIDGFTEKYGMEYRKAYWDEQEDEHLIRRHENDVFPLLRKRYLFSEVQNFVLYDFVDNHGMVNENIFAYSNHRDGERALIVYNNKYDRANGWIRYSSASADRGYTHSVRSGLSLSEDSNYYTIFKDYISGLEFIRNNQDLANQGLFVELDGFKYHVFMDFREVRDDEYHHYSQMAGFLNGRGVPDLDIALKETFLAPVHKPFHDLVCCETAKLILNKKITTPRKKQLIDLVSTNFVKLLEELVNYFSIDKKTLKDIPTPDKQIDLLFKLRNTNQVFKSFKAKDLNSIKLFTLMDEQKILLIYHWILINGLGAIQDKIYANLISLSWLDELLFDRVLQNVMSEQGYQDDAIYQHLQLLRVTILLDDWIGQFNDSPDLAFAVLIEQPESNKFLQVNRHQDILYLNKESLEKLTSILFIISIMKKGVSTKLSGTAAKLKKLLKIASDSGYQVEKIIEQLK